jgi:Ca-activated chloride channel homolog
MLTTVHLISHYRALAVLGLCAASALGQSGTPAQQAPTSGAIRVDVELVNLLCTVQDRSGTDVTNLSQKDFTVLEDGKPQPITRFARQTDQALTVALLFDVSFSMQTSLSAETDDARQFFRSILRPGDAVTLGGFAAVVGLWRTVTSSRPELEQALDHVPDLGEKLRHERMTATEMRPVQNGYWVTLKGDGGSRLFDAVDMVSTDQLRTLTGRKVIIALTDGDDDSSQRTLKEAARSAQEADAIFFGIDPSDRGGVGMEILSDLASQTGGRAFQIDKHTTIEAALKAIEDQIRNQYAIGYAPPDDQKRGTFHKVQVQVYKPGLKVRVRNGYFR